MSDNNRLPTGWTMTRVRQVAQMPSAELWAYGGPVVVETYPHGNNVDRVREPLQADLILRFGDLVLVRPVEDEDWYMGQVVDDVIVLWASYGPDLERAIHGL